MAELFSVDRTSIQRHIQNIIRSGELDESTCAFFAHVQYESNRLVRRNIRIYNLDMIIAVGYRVNSKRGTVFRQWANKVLRQYLLRGFAIDPSRCLISNENYISLVNVVNDMKCSQVKLEDRVAFVISIHRLGLIVKALLPAALRRGSNSTPLKFGLLTLPSNSNYKVSTYR